MVHLSKEAIFAASDLPTREVDVPEWGGKVLVGTMGLDDRLAYEEICVKAEGRSVLTHLVALCVVDDNGNKLFSAEDIERLGKKNATVLTRIVRVATELNAMGFDAVASAEKNSASGPAAASPSDSLSASVGPSASSKAA